MKTQGKFNAAWHNQGWTSQIPAYVRMQQMLLYAVIDPQPRHGNPLMFLMGSGQLQAPLPGCFDNCMKIRLREALPKQNEQVFLATQGLHGGGAETNQGSFGRSSPGAMLFWRACGFKV